MREPAVVLKIPNETLQILPKEPQYPVEQMFAGGVAGDAVVLAGVDLHIEINSCVDKGIDVGGGVAEEDVVIIQAVNYEQFAVEAVDAVYG